MEEEDTWVLVDSPPVDGSLTCRSRSIRFVNWLVVMFVWSRTAATTRMVLFACVYCAARYVGLGHALAMQLAVFCLAR
jgi:hypothetical protein